MTANIFFRLKDIHIHLQLQLVLRQLGRQVAAQAELEHGAVAGEQEAELVVGGDVRGGLGRDALGALLGDGVGARRAVEVRAEVADVLAAELGAQHQDDVVNVDLGPQDTVSAVTTLATNIEIPRHDDASQPRVTLCHVSRCVMCHVSRCVTCHV